MHINRRLTVVVCSLVLMTGCGKPEVRPADQNAVEPTTGSASSAGPVDPSDPGDPAGRDGLPSRDVVTAALLTAAELPGSYTPFPVDPANAPAAQLGQGVQGCTNESAGTEPSVHALAVHQGGPVGPFVAEAITVTSGSAATRTMRGLVNVTANCARFGGELPGGIKVDVALDPLTFPRMADEVAAFRVTLAMPGAGVAMYAHVVYVRAGRLLISTTLMQMSSPDVADTEKIVRAAAGKAVKHLRG
jgi:hypothetical protein